MTLAHRLTNLAFRYGIEVHRYDPSHSSQARFFKMIETRAIDTVIDVGANDGGYGRFLRMGGYKGAIVSFEPLQDEHQRLIGAAEGDRLWFVAPRMALGDDHRDIDINVAGNSCSSSILLMNSRHELAAPDSRYVGVQRVPLRRLDQVAHPAIQRGRSVLLKVDTQGFEMPVLRGAEKLLQSLAGVQLELSLTELYDGQVLYLDMLRWLADRGFELWNVMPGFVDQASGRLLQFDGIFFRSKC
jgi:FkbM family methyltransferase